MIASPFYVVYRTLPNLPRQRFYTSKEGIFVGFDTITGQANRDAAIAGQLKQFPTRQAAIRYIEEWTLCKEGRILDQGCKQG